MFMSKSGFGIGALILLIGASFYLGIPYFAEQIDNRLGIDLKPQLGELATEVSVLIVSPDGAGLPQGSGTVFGGEQLYNMRCAQCHGRDGRQRGNQLVGGIGSLATDRPKKTVGSYWPYATTLYDYIANAMPYNEEKSLTASEVYAATAYVLFLNGLLEKNAVLDQKNLALVVMPNRDGFVELPQ